ncbi:glycosyltransferase [Limnohabitans sp.]|uniref:MraY family glycosyltransferase n=1 Tax=Limnohabitans sp. TaxID=1907725 RepID=UPI00333E4656
MNTLHALQGVFQSPALQAAAWGFVSTFALCVLMVITKRWHGALTMDFTDGVQKFHTAPTPRVGGIPIVLGLVVAWGKAPADMQAMLTPILFAGLPAFIFGVAEDITKRVGVMQRLLATMASGLLAWWITDYSLSRVDIWGVDWLLTFTLASVIFTAFAVGGVANSINIIDGFNGLASTMSTLAFVGYAMIAWQVGDNTLAGVSLVLAACVWGFFWVNWPFGKLFLGDGGSYFIGFALAWVAVLLIERNPSVSAFAALMVCVHPVTEVLFSIYRRRIKQLHPGHPDRLHFHSLVKQRYVRRWFPSLPSAVRNSITGVLIGGMTLTAAVAAALVHSSPWLSAAVFAALALGYVAVYARMVRHHWCSPLQFLLVKPAAKPVRA